MTKFILVGGYTSAAPDGGKAFCEAFIEGHPEPVKILSCLFAREEQHWQSTLEGDKQFYAEHAPNTAVEIRLADPNDFVSQVKWADAIFLRGGDTENLVRLLNQNPGWDQHLEGKTIAGTSAGADALSTYYYDIERLYIREGLGLVKAKTLVHYYPIYVMHEIF